MDENDPRVVALSKLAKELFPGQVFFIAVASLKEDVPVASIANVTADVQAMLLRALLRSFETGEATAMRPVEVL
jgi:hypothetical protein